MALHDEDDLNLAIQKFRTVPDLEDCPNGMVVPPRGSVASALESRYELRYDIDNIDLAVEAYAAVIDMLQQQPREYLFACIGYAMVLHAWFCHKGNADDLQVAIRYFEVVIRRCPPGHQHYTTALTFYATFLIVRSEQVECIQDIDRVIECIRNGKAAGCIDNLSRHELLSTLGYCLITRFLHWGSATDLESAVENCYDAVSLDSHLDAGTRAGNMNRLAFALFSCRVIGWTLPVPRPTSSKHWSYVLGIIPIAWLSSITTLAFREIWRGRIPTSPNLTFRSIISTKHSSISPVHHPDQFGLRSS